MTERRLNVCALGLVLAALALGSAQAQAQSRATSVASFKPGVANSGGSVSTFTSKAGGSSARVHTVKGDKDTTKNQADKQGPTPKPGAKPQAKGGHPAPAFQPTGFKGQGAPVVLATNSICVVRRPGDAPAPMPELPPNVSPSKSDKTTAATAEKPTDKADKAAATAQKPAGKAAPEKTNGLKRNVFSLSSWLGR